VLVLAPYLRHLPSPILASIVTFAMVQVVDFGAIRRYAKNVRIELVVLSLVACAVVLFGAIVGVVLGVVASLLTQLYRSHATGNQMLVGFKGGRDDSGLDYTVPDSMLVRYLVGFLSFSNIDHTLEAIREDIHDGIDTVVLELSGVTNIDATATETLRRFINTLRDQGVLVRIVRSLALANDHYTRYELRRIMKRVHAYPTVRSAIEDVNRMKRKQMLDIPLDQADDAAGNDDLDQADDEASNDIPDQADGEASNDELGEADGEVDGDDLGQVDDEASDDVPDQVDGADNGETDG